ncbi:ketol-acid reductoisomerase [bacterium]|nr:ketol-acid reductoisomerase [bacterium]
MITWPPDPRRPLEERAVSLAPLHAQTVAMIGYGTMGRAHALNLRDSGIAVIVGLREGSPRREVAARAGLEVRTVAAATAASDVVMLMLPDEAMATVFAAEVGPHLGAGAMLGFAHGFAVAFDQIDPGDRGCFLVAPKSQGDMLRSAYEAGGGAPGLLAVTPESPPETWPLCAAYARAVGCLRGGGWPTTFREECVSDQFGEQAVLCGGVIELLQAAFDTLTDRGYDATNAYFECVHELELITDLVHRYGVDGMRARISPTAAYGGLTRGPRLIDGTVRARMAEILDEIEDGRFAREFLASHEDRDRGRAALSARESSSRLAGTGRELQARLNDLVRHRPSTRSEETRDE